MVNHFCTNAKCDKNDLDRIPMEHLIELHNISTTQVKIDNPEVAQVFNPKDTIMDRTFE